MRDLDLLKEIDEKLAKLFETGAPSPKVRLGTMKKCKEQGFLVGVNYIPVLPFLSDSDSQLDKMIRTAKDYGAEFALVGALTLFGKGPADCKTLYYRVLEKYFPELIPKYKSLFRIFPMPSKEYQRQLKEQSADLCQKHGIKYSII